MQSGGFKYLQRFPPFGRLLQLIFDTFPTLDDSLPWFFWALGKLSNEITTFSLPFTLKRKKAALEVDSCVFSGRCWVSTLSSAAVRGCPAAVRGRGPGCPGCGSLDAALGLPSPGQRRQDRPPGPPLGRAGAARGAPEAPGAEPLSPGTGSPGRSSPGPP